MTTTLHVCFEALDGGDVIAHLIAGDGDDAPTRTFTGPELEVTEQILNLIHAIMRATLEVEVLVQASDDAASTERASRFGQTMDAAMGEQRDDD